LSTAFAEELTRWGPARTGGSPPSMAESQGYCRQLATTHYENFPVVSCLLPPELHQHFYNIYAYCRWSDDLGDEIGDDARSLELLAWWRGELADCFAGRTSHPVFVALRGTIEEYAIPIQPFENLISAFEQDQRVKAYETFDQLRDYCRRSADPVGRLVLYLCRQATPANFTWSDSICTGLQLANFWQDVARDFSIGRVYLPQDDCRQFGYSAEDLRGKVTNAPFLELMRFEVDRARTFLRPWRNSRRPELKSFPFRVQIDLELFSRGGEKILDRIAAIEYRVWDSRPVVSKRDLPGLFLCSVGSALRRRWFA
jgi:squalene synthase HpnC